MNKRMPFVGFCSLIPLIALFVLAAMFVTPAHALAQTATPPVILGPYSSDTAIMPSSLDVDLRTLPGVNVTSSPTVLPLKRNPNVSSQPAAAAPAQPDQIDSPAAMPSASSSFAGLDFSHYGGGWPPDTNGDVGPVYYIQMVNTAVGIFNKTTGSLAAAFTMNSFFNGTGGLCDANNMGDPVVVYDAQTDRWLVSDFAFATNSSGNAIPPYYECIAVSKTGDPLTGGWWRYAYAVGTINSATYMNDYPKFAVWPDAIYMSANMFPDVATTAWGMVRVWALDKSRLYAGLSLSEVHFDLPSAYFTLLPAMWHGQLPPAGSPEYFTSIAAPNSLYLWKLKVDFNTPGNSTFTGPTTLAVNSFTANATLAPQLNSTEQVDLLNDRLMMQVQYRRIGSIESLWATHTVDAGGTTGIRWYEVRNPNGAPSIYQQGTFAPDTAFRFMPSLAVDQTGNMAVGYSVASSSMYPAIRYAGRLMTDTLGTLGRGESTLIAGTGSQSGGYNRWGDYSAMSIDPLDDCTFWYTNEYYATTGSNWQTRIGSFRYPECVNTSNNPAYIISGTVRDAARGAPLSATLTIAGYYGGSVSTNPTTGFYSVSLPISVTYVFNVSAVVNGYQQATRVVGPLSGPGTQDFALSVDPVTCNAPGYVSIGGFAVNFDSITAPGLPTGWISNVITYTTGALPSWFTNVGTRFPAGVAAHSAPNVALFNSYNAASGSAARLARSIPVDMTGVPDPRLWLWMYHDNGYPGSSDIAQVQVSTDGGASWINAGIPLTRTESPYGWRQHVIDLSAYSNQASLRVSILAVSRYGNDIHLDDITIPGVCQPVSGNTITVTNSSPTTLGNITYLTATINITNPVFAWSYGDGFTDTGATVNHVYPLSGTYTALATASNGVVTQSATTAVTITNLAPVAVAGSNQTVTVTALVTLDGSGSYDLDGHMPLTYIWRQTSGTPVILSNLAISRPAFTAPVTPTILAFALTVTDARGLVTAAPASTVVTVTDIKVSNPLATNSSPTTLGQTTTLTVAANGSGVTYAWRFGDGGIGAGAIVSRVYSTTGIYTAIVTATNSVNVLTTTTVVTITNLPPVAVSGVNQSVTVSTVVTLNGSGSYDPDGHVPLLYRWRQTGGTTVVLSSAVITRPTFTAPATPSVLTFTLNVTDARGLAGAASSQTVVTITDSPISSVVANNNSPTTLGQTTTLTATANGSNTSFVWTFGDGTSGSGATVSHVYPLSGTFTAMVTATNATNSLTATTSVTISNLPPVANAGASQSVTVSSVVTLTGSASTDPDGHTPLVYGWTQSGGAAVVLSSAIISRPTFSAPSAPTVLTFTLTVTDARGLASVAAASTIITVSDSAITGVVARNDSPTTLGQTTTLTVTANGSNVVYAWDFGDGTPGAGATVNHVYPLSGTYTAVVTATNATNNLTATTSVTITNLPPVAIAAASQSVPIGSLVMLDGSASNDPDGHLPLLYGWRQTGGITVTLSNASISRTTFIAPAAPSVLTFTLTVTDAQGLVSSTFARTVVTVTDAPITNVVATNDSPTTLGQTTTLTVTSNGTPGAVAYVWRFGDGAVGSGAAVTHVYALSGAFTAIVTATNAINSLTATTSVTITNFPPVANAGVNQSVTVSSVVTLDGSASTDPDGHTPLVYGWTQTGGSPIVLSSASISQPTFTAPTAPTVLTFTLTVTDARGLASIAAASTVISVSDAPITNITATNDSPTTLGQTTTLTATANGTPGAAVYAWDYGDGTPGSGTGPIVSHIYPLAGTYTAVVTATNSASAPGITATTTVSITPILLACTPLSDITVTGAITGLVDSLQPFTATVAPLTATLPLTYTWQADGQAVIITQTTLYTNFISYSWPVIGQPMITATAANGCSTLSTTTVIAIQREYRIYVPIVLK